MLDRMLDVDLGSRITIAEIMEHEWFKMAGNATYLKAQTYGTQPFPKVARTRLKNLSRKH